MDIASNLASASDHEPSLPAQWQNQWIGGMGLLTLLAFTWLPNSYSYMVGWPYILIWQGAFFILGIYTIRVCRQFSIPFGRLGYGLDGVVVLTIVAATLSTLNAQFRAVACWNLLLIINYAVCLYLLVNWLRYGKLTRHLLWAMLSITGIVTSIISLALWRPNINMWLSQDFNAAIRNAQPLGHHNFVGGYELLLLPIVGGFTLSQPGWRRKLGVAATGIVAIALYASGSRGALVGALAMSLVSIGLGFLFSEKRNYRRWITAGFGLLLVMMLALASNPRIRALFTISPATEANKVSVVSISDGPTKDRIFMLETAHNIFAKHPLIGVGPGNLSRVYNTYRPLNAGTGLSLVQQLHNTPAQLVAELGLLGFSIYASLIIAIIRLGVLLHTRITEHRDRLLLYSISASWIGYIVSSLSDYQLENIGISITLTITIALLVDLADTYKPKKHNLELSNRTRRISSLVLLLILCANFQLWTRVDAGLYIGDSAIKDSQRADFASADLKWAKASKLVPWDPTYPALAAETIISLLPDIKSDKDATNLELMAIDYLKDTVKASPNDPWFNQNLAALLLNHNPQEAETYAEQAVRLSPRSVDTYTYYVLGLSYLQQGKTSKAIEAFTLEALSNPIFLTASMWDNGSLSPLKEAVVNKTLNIYQQVLSETSKASIQYQWLQEQKIFISWWYNRPIAKQELAEVQPLVRAIVTADDQPQQSLQWVNEYIQKNGESSELHLIQARLSPQQYLPGLLVELNGTEEEREQLKSSITRKQSMKSWLNEALVEATILQRYGTIYAYRNIMANTIREILSPKDIRVGVLFTSDYFFLPAPREYPQLDQYMSKLRIEKLQIKD